MKSHFYNKSIVRVNTSLAQNYDRSNFKTIMLICCNQTFKNGKTIDTFCCTQEYVKVTVHENLFLQKLYRISPQIWCRVGGRVGRVTDRGLGFKSPGSILTSRTETSSLSRVVRDGWDPCSVPLKWGEKGSCVGSTWQLPQLFRKLHKNSNKKFNILNARYRTFPFSELFFVLAEEKIVTYSTTIKNV